MKITNDMIRAARLKYRNITGLSIHSSEIRSILTSALEVITNDVEIDSHLISVDPIAFEGPGVYPAVIVVEDNQVRVFTVSQKR